MRKALRCWNRTISSIWSAPTSCCRNMSIVQIAVDQIRGQSTESFNGTLLSTQGGIVLRRDDGTVQVLPHNAGVRLPALPGGLITRPTLVWDIAAQRPGTHRSRVSYQTQGLTWWADYNVVYAEGANANACRLDVGAWVSIVNQSGASYADSRLKLVAGDVHRARPATPASVGMANNLRSDAAAERDCRFRRKVILRIPPVHAGPHDHAARQFNQADRAVSLRAPRAVRKDARLLRRPGRLSRISVFTGDRSQLRRAKQPQGRCVPAIQECGEQQHGHAAARRSCPRLKAGPGRSDARVHRRRHHRPHAAQRKSAAEARLRVRRGRRTAAGGFQGRYNIARR